MAQTLNCSNQPDLTLHNRNLQKRQAYEKLSTWHPQIGELKAVALTIHGLNTDPHKMHQWIHWQNQHGIKTLNVVLPGHRGDLQEMRHISIDQWREEFFATYCMANVEAQSQGVPLLLMGYSLGALVAYESLLYLPQINFDGMILLAPALKTRAWTKPAGWIRGTWLVPSKAPLFYRANKRGTSFNAYWGLHYLRKRINHFKFSSNIKLPPQLIFVDAKDELVSANALAHFFKQPPLNEKSEVILVSNQQAKIKPRYHHLIIDQFSTGEEQWRLMTAKMKSFLLQLY